MTLDSYMCYENRKRRANGLEGITKTCHAIHDVIDEVKKLTTFQQWYFWKKYNHQIKDKIVTPEMQLDVLQESYRIAKDLSGRSQNYLVASYYLDFGGRK